MTTATKDTGSSYAPPASAGLVAAIMERMNDVQNYMCHVELFPTYLPAGTFAADELATCADQLGYLRAQLADLAVQS
jgi:hypothetical protein